MLYVRSDEELKSKWICRWIAFVLYERFERNEGSLAIKWNKSTDFACKFEEI